MRFACTVKSFFGLFPSVFGAPLITPACLARLGARAAIRTCATVARQRLRCEVAVPPLNRVLRSRRRSFGAVKVLC